MALTSRERAKLRSQANDMDTILQIGKSGVVDNLLIQIDDALKAREMIKIRVLETAPVSPKEASVIIAENANCDVVQVIGTKIVLYKENKKEPKFKKK